MYHVQAGCVISEPLPENRAKQTDHLTLEADPRQGVTWANLGMTWSTEEWGYLLYPGVWTAPPVQAERPAGDDPMEAFSRAMTMDHHIGSTNSGDSLGESQQVPSGKLTVCY